MDQRVLIFFSPDLTVFFLAACEGAAALTTDSLNGAEEALGAWNSVTCSGALVLEHEHNW